MHNNYSEKCHQIGPALGTRRMRKKKGPLHREKGEGKDGHPYFEKFHSKRKKKGRKGSFRVLAMIRRTGSQWPACDIWVPGVHCRITPRWFGKKGKGKRVFFSFWLEQKGKEERKGGWGFSLLREAWRSGATKETFREAKRGGTGLNQFCNRLLERGKRWRPKKTVQPRRQFRREKKRGRFPRFSPTRRGKREKFALSRQPEVPQPSTKEGPTPFIFSGRKGGGGASTVVLLALVDEKEEKRFWPRKKGGEIHPRLGTILTEGRLTAESRTEKKSCFTSRKKIA